MTVENQISGTRQECEAPACLLFLQGQERAAHEPSPFLMGLPLSSGQRPGTGRGRLGESLQVSQNVAKVRQEGQLASQGHNPRHVVEGPGGRTQPPPLNKPIHLL